MNTSKSLDSIIDSIQDYTIQSALGGSPFKSEAENKADNDKAYTEGRAKAKAAIVEAVEGLIPPENPELKVHTYVAGLHDGYNNCRKQVLQAIKEWQ